MLSVSIIRPKKWYFPGQASKCKGRNGHCDDFFFHLGRVNENIWIFFPLNDFKHKI